jgi:predicted Zn-dependent protease
MSKQLYERVGMRGIGLLLLIAASLNLTGCRTRSFFSTRDEISMGKEGARQIEQEFRVDTSSPDAERVRKIAQKILPHVDARDVPYSFKVLDVKEVNAVSLPGGPVYVFRGLLDMLGDDDDALACVIGHEIGHVNGRHAARQMSSQLLTQLLLIAGTQAGGLTDPNAVRAVGMGAQVIGLTYSREDEYDADRRGLSYAYRAGFDPRGMVRFFEKLERMERRLGGRVPEWLRSHPVNTSRIDRAEVLIENKNYRYGQ